MWRRWIFIRGDALTKFGNEAEDGACDGRLGLFAQEEKVRREMGGMGDGDVERGWTGGGGWGGSTTLEVQVQVCSEPSCCSLPPRCGWWWWIAFPVTTSAKHSHTLTHSLIHA